RYTADAIRSTLNANNDTQFITALTQIISRVAPTARLISGDSDPLVDLRRPASATWLTRWSNLGLGPEEPYKSFRIGILPEPAVSTDAYVELVSPKIATCNALEARAHVRANLSGAVVKAYLIANGQDRKVVSLPVEDGESTPVLRLEMPPSTGGVL